MTLLFHLVGVQRMPSAFACMGYVLIVPGVIVILIGNCLFTRTTNPLPIMEKLVLSKTISDRGQIDRIREETSKGKNTKRIPSI